MNNVIRLQLDSFDVGEEIERLERLSGNDGAIGIFIGKVRNDGHVKALFLETYKEMAEEVLFSLCEKAQEKFALTGCTIIHRFGRLLLGEKIVFVGTSAPHRAQALDGVSYLIDQLKTSAPFWKKLENNDGHQEWIKQQQSDVEKSHSWIA